MFIRDSVAKTLDAKLWRERLGVKQASLQKAFNNEDSMQSFSTLHTKIIDALKPEINNVLMMLKLYLRRQA
jgi:hypothetical protein